MQDPAPERAPSAAPEVGPWAHGPEGTPRPAAWRKGPSFPLALPHSVWTVHPSPAAEDAFLGLTLHSNSIFQSRAPPK